MLDVERCPDIDARAEQFLHILPALGMAAVGGVGVGELVDENRLRLAGEGGVEVELLERAAAIIDPPSRQNFQALEERFRLAPPMRLDQTDQDVVAEGFGRARAGEHCISLAHSGRCAQEDAQPAFAFLARKREQRVGIRPAFQIRLVSRQASRSGPARIILADRAPD